VRYLYVDIDIVIYGYVIFICNNIIDNYNYCGMGNEQGKEPYYLDAKKINPMKVATNKNTFQDYEQEHQYNEGTARARSSVNSAIMIFMILLLVILLASLLLRSRKKSTYK
jgi:hypothetical protein